MCRPAHVGGVQVALQHEFTMLRLGPILEELETHSAEEVRKQIEAFNDNAVNVAELVGV